MTILKCVQVGHAALYTQEPIFLIHMGYDSAFRKESLVFIKSSFEISIKYSL